mmetsp:Transcript_11729/g.30101  ORF Transcript_11729/g.30101 Transcript_11729/m.30101 type:complete len:557 (+) Transcript_11729:95-1765(+)
MKFGKSIVSQREGHSKFRYLDYKVLKKDINDVAEKVRTTGLGDALEANMVFEEALAAEIRQVNTCFAEKQQGLMNLIASLASELSLGRKAAEGTASLQEVGSDALARVGNLLRRLVDVLHEVDQLRMYAVWNAVAVVKILKKRRKRTKFGLEDMAGERAGWLSRQTFFSGADFAELHAAIESLGNVLVRLELAPPSSELAAVLDTAREPRMCPICLDSVTDVVELSCAHAFCWKCFVLGPIAFQPGEYRISSCPICRQETSGTRDTSAARPSGEGGLSTFLRTYFPQESRAERGEQKDAREALEMRDVVKVLVEALLGDARRGLPHNFLQSLPKSRGPIGAVQKLQWLQLALLGDPFALDGITVCSICSEPLLFENPDATLTTPCKHHFHRACVQTLTMPECLLCAGPLPHTWFLPPDHPCIGHGFRAVPVEEYRPVFPGGPSRCTGGYPLRQPPPERLLGPGGLRMRSYLHLTVPSACTGAEFLGAEVDEPPGHCHGLQNWSGSMNDSASSFSEASVVSSAESVQAPEQGEQPTSLAYSALGRMRLVDKTLDEDQ